jgi:hypothetical protein
LGAVPIQMRLQLFLIIMIPPDDLTADRWVKAISEIEWIALSSK